MPNLGHLTALALAFAGTMIFVHSLALLRRRRHAIRVERERYESRLAYRRLEESVAPIRGFAPRRAMEREKVKQHGQALIEFVVLFPVACLCVVAALDVGVLVGACNNLAFVTMQTAQCAAQACNANPAQWGTGLAGGLGLSPSALTLTASCTPTNAPTQCTAAANYSYKPFGPWPAQVIGRTATAVVPPNS